MKIIDPNNQLQKEALLNEYKGNIFEFLVGLNLSRKYFIELEYLNSINADLMARLTVYEQFIRESQLNLIEKLHVLGINTANQIILKLENLDFIPNEIYLIGKSVATNDNSLWSESDLVLVKNQNNSKIKIMISLKLSKDNSFTNTKSAGIKSFIKKYFNLFSQSSVDQNILNREVDEAFYQMGEALYRDVGLKFEGSFKGDWSENYPTLPGELNQKHRSILFINYSRVMSQLYEILRKYKNENPSLFMKCLLPLCGFGQSEIMQVTCFHHHHEFSKIKILLIEELQKEINFGVIKEMSENSHFFEIQFPSFVLQIRIKPMNKFTIPSYKVNCSIKESKNE